MNKKTLSILLWIILLFSCCIVSSSAASLTPAMDVISKSTPITINGIKDNPLKLTKNMLKQLLNCKVLGKITVTSLPDSQCGILSLNGRPVEEGETITGKQLDSLVFVPTNNGSDTSTIGLTVFSSGICYYVDCNVILMDKLNFSPTINSSYESINVSTFENVSIYSSLEATDPENDPFHFQVIEYPQKGLLTLCDSNNYCYTPFNSAMGKDTFKIIAVDCYGNKSLPCDIIINISKLENGQAYSDMKSHPNAYAATLLSEFGIFTGEQFCGIHVFRPDKTVSVGEFLSYAMSAAKISPNNTKDTACSVTDANLLDDHIKGYVHKAELLGYLDCKNTLANAPITFTNAVEIINRICNYSTGTTPVFSINQNTTNKETIAINTLLSYCPNASIPENPSNHLLTRAECAQLIVDAMSADIV